MARKRKRMRRGNDSAKKWIEKDFASAFDDVEKSEREVHSKW